MVHGWSRRRPRRPPPRRSLRRARSSPRSSPCCPARSGEPPTLVSGIVQGVGTELAFAIFGYGAFGLVAAIVAGGLAGPFAATYESTNWVKDWALGWKLAYAGILTASGAVVAGAGGWLVTRALARAGALGAFPAGQEERESRAV